MIPIIENNALSYFTYLPQLAGFSVKIEKGLTLMNCGLGSSMFNIVYGGFHENITHLDQKIEHMISEFHGQPFAWWIGPSDASKDLKHALLKRGFVIEVPEHAMLCDLSQWHHDDSKSSKLDIKQVITSKQLDDFVTLLDPYDPTARRFYETISEPMLKEKLHLYVGYAEGTPAIIGSLYVEHANQSSSIFSLITHESKRGLGYGTEMMYYFLNTSKTLGIKYVTLSASSDAGFRICERLGFKKVGHFECYEWFGEKRE